VKCVQWWSEVCGAVLSLCKGLGTTHVARGSYG
jgi:hypothetical protein